MKEEKHALIQATNQRKINCSQPSKPAAILKPKGEDKRKGAVDRL